MKDSEMEITNGIDSIVADAEKIAENEKKALQKEVDKLKFEVLCWKGGTIAVGILGIAGILAVVF